MPPWAYRFFDEFYHMDAATVDTIPARHHEYADVVRSVATTPSSLLVDAETEFTTAREPVSELFRADLIHLRPAGHERMAEAVTEALANAFAGRAPEGVAPHAR
jgi:lysophospholipase L1-like esterase